MKRQCETASTENKRFCGNTIPEMQTAGADVTTDGAQPAPWITIQEEALSNFLILKQIFTNLSYKDLLSCCDASDTWKSVADPMMCYYGVTMKERSSSRVSCEVEKIFGYDGAPQHYSSCTHELIKRLKKETRRVSIELKITEHEPYLDNYIPFLTEFGHRVHEFRYESLSASVQIRRYARFLSYLPNLEVLRSNNLRLQGNRASSLRTLSATPFLTHLRAIHFDESVNAMSWGLVLFIAHNVKELRGFPIGLSAWLSDFMLVNPQRVLSLTGFNLQPEINLNLFEASLQTLAEVGLKVTEAAVPNFYQLTGRINATGAGGWDPKSEQARKIKTHVLRVLESSKETVQSLAIPPASYLDYYFPLPFQMNSVKTLIFEDNAAFSYHFGNSGAASVDPPKEEHRYFPPGTDLKAMFPNLKGIEINFSHLNHHIAPFFPQDSFGSAMLGSSIKSLKTSILSSFGKLSTLFPHVTHLELQSTVDHFERVFPEICTGWPGLESLTVNIESTESFHKYPNEAYYSLDSVLTGIPEWVCAVLHRTIIWHKRICSVRVRKYQEKTVSLVNMKNLKLLKFIAEEPGCRLCNQNHLLSMITPLAIVYAIKPLKNLQASVQIGKKVEML